MCRGDLGVGFPAEKGAGDSEARHRRAAELAKPVIVATQMLESGDENPRPTRASSDVANAFLTAPMR